MGMELKPVFTGVRQELLKRLTPEQRDSVQYLPEIYQKALDTLLGRQKEVDDGRRLWQAEDPAWIKDRVSSILATAKLMKQRAEDIKAIERGEDTAFTKGVSEDLAATASALAV
jgi:hypothetical protein